jgi:hypothetical protein
MSESVPFKKYDKVVTADEVFVGEILRIHHRQEDVNPELRLYASYLELWSIEFGGHSYVPTDYIDEYDEATGTIYLTETVNTFQQETWDRAPSFIAGRQSRREELPLGAALSVS